MDIPRGAMHIPHIPHCTMDIPLCAMDIPHCAIDITHCAMDIPSIIKTENHESIGCLFSEAFVRIFENVVFFYVLPSKNLVEPFKSKIPVHQRPSSNHHHLNLALVRVSVFNNL